MPRIPWRAATPVLAALAALVPFPAALVERVYAQGWYPMLQPRLTAATNLVPVGLLDFLILGVICWIIWCARRRWRSPEISRIKRAAALLLDVIGAAGLFYLAFLCCWGLNYQRLPATQRFAVREELITPDARLALVNHAVREINGLHERSRDDRRLDFQSVATDLAPAFAATVQALGVEWEPTPGHPKRSLIGHAFPWAAVDGMINPIGLEVLVNPEVLPFERPFVIAHEWAHLAGNAAESDASFVGWLACLRAGRTARYSGWLSIYLHLLRGLPRGDVTRSMERLGDGPRQDIQAIRERLLRAQPRIQSVTWRIYDRYLRANRVRSGVASYDEVATLVLGSEFAAAHRPRSR